MAAGKNHHYVIFFDRTTNSELGRVEVKPIARPDVARAVPGVYHADQSGFTAKIALNKVNLNHQIQIISRYSASADGNSDYLDYWFNSITGANQVNQG